MVFANTPCGPVRLTGDRQSEFRASVGINLVDVCVLEQIYNILMGRRKDSLMVYDYPKF